MSIEGTPQSLSRSSKQEVHSGSTLVSSDQATHNSEKIPEFTGEATRENLKKYVDYLTETGRKFDSALNEYHELLLAQQKTENSNNKKLPVVKWLY